MCKMSYVDFKKSFEHSLNKRKRLLGDIPLTDDMIKQLYLVTSNLLQNPWVFSKKKDIVIAVALVRVGMHEYKEGTYWVNFNNSIGLNLNSNQQTKLGLMFLRTLEFYELPIYKEGTINKYVQNILVQGLVPDNYMLDFINFVWSFYDANLSRELSYSLEEELDLLFAVLKKELNNRSQSENVSFTVGRVPQSANLRITTLRGLTLASSRGRSVIIHLLKLMDIWYWYNKMPKVKCNRYNKAFIIWAESVKGQTAATLEEDKYRNRKKTYHYTIPYREFTPEPFQFFLVIPEQKMEQDQDKVKSECLIKMGDIIRREKLSLYDIFGRQCSMEIKLAIKPEDIFAQTRVDFLLREEKNIANIPKNNICLFDDNFVEIKKVKEGVQYLITEPEVEVEVDSDLSLSKISQPNYVLYRLDLKAEDILFIDSVGYSPSGNLEEGLVPKGKLEGVLFSNSSGESISVYSKHPHAIFITNDCELTGIALLVNQKRLRLSNYIGSNKIATTELQDGTGRYAVFLNLRQLLPTESGLFNVSIEIPKEEPLVIGKYAYFPSLSYLFEDAPYIFTARGVLTLENASDFQPQNAYRINELNSFLFSLHLDDEQVIFQVNRKEISGLIKFEIPVLKWKLPNYDWCIHSEESIWHDKFIDTLLIRLPTSTSVTLLLEGKGDFVTGIPQKDDWIHSFDLNKFRGYVLESQKSSGKIMTYIDIEGKEYKVQKPFAEILSKNYLNSTPTFINLYDSAECKIVFDAVGENKMVTKITDVLSKKLLVDNVPLVNNKLIIEQILPNGKYSTTICEIIDDEFGLLKNKRQIYSEVVEVFDPYDLSKKEFQVVSIKQNIFKTKLGKKYFVVDLTHTCEKGVYLAKLVTKEDKSSRKQQLYCDVKIKFPNIEDQSKAFLWGLLDNDWVVFLLDIKKDALILEQHPKIVGKEAYKRYAYLDDEDCLFYLQF